MPLAVFVASNRPERSHWRIVSDDRFASRAASEVVRISSFTSTQRGSRTTWKGQPRSFQRRFIVLGRVYLDSSVRRGNVTCRHPNGALVSADRVSSGRPLRGVSFETRDKSDSNTAMFVLPRRATWTVGRAACLRRATKLAEKHNARTMASKQRLRADDLRKATAGLYRLSSASFEPR
jgi:hypothetical protein